MAIALAATAVFLLSMDAIGAEGKKARWLTSIYMDAQGNPLRYPEGVSCGEDSFMVADTGNSRLLRFTYGDEIATVEEVFPLPRTSPVVVQTNSRGDLYYLDSREQDIGILDSTGEKRGKLDPKDLPSKTTIIPKSFKIDRDDNIYVLDIFSERVLVLDPDGRYSRHVDFPESYGFFSDLAIDPAGTIILLDGSDATLYAARRKAESFTRLGESLKEYMNYPTSLASDGTGTLYLVDQFGSGLAAVGRDGSFLGRLLGMGWTESRLYYPSQVCINPDGILLIADRSNSRVQIFTLGED